MMSATVVVLVVYLAILGALAIWSRSETRSPGGFFLADKKLPFWVVAFSTNATGESGWLLLGLTGMGYAVGAQAYWVVVGEVIGIALSWILISRRLKRLSDETDSITLPDVISARFDDNKNILRSIAVVIILTMVCAYVTAQMVASGKALSSFIGMNYSSAVIIGAAIIIAYTFVGDYPDVKSYSAIPHRSNGYADLSIRSTEEVYAYLRSKGATFPLIEGINNVQGIDSQPGYKQILAVDSEGNLVNFSQYLEY